MTDGAPLRAIEFMVRRNSRNGLAIGPDEAIGVEDALRAYTIDAAYACHREHVLGSIAPGKYADFVVLADDPRTVEVDRIGDIEVRASFVGGELAYGSV